MKELEWLRDPITEDVNNFKEHHRLFTEQKNKIKKHGGVINE